MNESITTLLAPWKALIERIVAFEYDCSFEWRGETDDSHDSYLADLQRLELEATEALQHALDAEGADHEGLLAGADEVCRQCEQEGGWGAQRCRTTIANSR